MSFLVFSEDNELAFQLLGMAREFSVKLGVDVVALAVGSDPEEFLRYGANRVLNVSDMRLKEFNVETYRAVVLEAVKQVEPSMIVIGATRRGKELAPRIAAAVGAGCMTECTDVSLNAEGNIIIERLTYGGSTIAKETSHSKTTVITVPFRAFEKVEYPDNVGEINDLKVVVPVPRVRVLERMPKPKSDVDLENADLIVSAGRGFKAREDLQMLYDLAEVIGAQVGCTRPISADLGWMDDWIGISGKKVKPNLYLACGISGTIQHVAGIRDSTLIVSINDDKSAGIHAISDYSLVGDIYEVIPALIEAFKERL